MFSFPLGKYIGVELMGHSKYMFNFIRNYLIVFHNEHHFTCPPKMLKFQLLHMLVNTWCCPSFQRKLLWLMTCSASFHVRVNICITYFSKVFVQLFPFLQKVYWLSNVELTLKSWICPPWTWCSILKKYHLVCLADILLGLLAFKFMKNICHGFTAVHFVWCWSDADFVKWNENFLPPIFSESICVGFVLFLS